MKGNFLYSRDNEDQLRNTSFLFLGGCDLEDVPRFDLMMNSGFSRTEHKMAWMCLNGRWLRIQGFLWGLALMTSLLATLTLFWGECWGDSLSLPSGCNTTGQSQYPRSSLSLWSGHPTFPERKIGSGHLRGYPILFRRLLRKSKQLRIFGGCLQGSVS